VASGASRVRGAKPKEVARVRRLRRNSTGAEMKLWLSLRDRRLSGHKFLRQVAIGSYVVDFICREHRLIIEVDGSQHFESKSDRIRDLYFSGRGYRTLRFWNSDVMSNLDGVLASIANELRE
jgi:very-short-patch-repair endonuclease